MGINILCRKVEVNVRKKNKVESGSQKDKLEGVKTKQELLIFIFTHFFFLIFRDAYALPYDLKINK